MRLVRPEDECVASYDWSPPRGARRLAEVLGQSTPYAAGKEKPNGSDDDTTPGIRKLSPMNRNVCGTVNAISASSRRAIRSRGQM